MIVPIITVAGTHGYDGPQWYKPGSLWLTFMAEQGFVPVGSDGRSFIWTTDANGWKFWRRWFGRSDHRDWEAGGHNLYAWIVPPIAPERRIPPAQTHVICHSHGLQVALYACSLGLKVQTLVSIGSPVRADMMAVAEHARANINYWMHVHSDDSDRIQWYGSIGDGAFRLNANRPHPLADINHAIPKAGHSGVINDPQWFGAWMPILDTMRQLHDAPITRGVRLRLMPETEKR